MANYRTLSEINSGDVALRAASMSPAVVGNMNIETPSSSDTETFDPEVLKRIKSVVDAKKITYDAGYDRGVQAGLDKAGLSDVINNYWRDYCDAMNRNDWKAISGTVAGAALLGMGAFWAAKKWKEYRRKRAEEDGISLSPELENA